MIPAQRSEMVDRRHRDLSVVWQRQFLVVRHSSLHYRAKETSQRDLSLIPQVNRRYLGDLLLGSKRMRASLERQGMPVRRKRVQRLMRLMGLRAICRQPRASQPARERQVYPRLGGT